MLQSMSSFSKQPKLDPCGATPLDWAVLVITTFTINISWWALELSTARKHGVKAYFEATCWQCLRVCMPCVAGIWAISHNPNLRLRWPRYYYFGPSSHDVDSARPMTTFDSAKVVSVDLFSIAATGMSIYKFCVLPAGYDFSGINTALYLYPSLPVAIIGL